MTPAVIAAVLGSAVLHTGWNAVAKGIPNRLAASALIGIAYAVIGAIGVFFVPLPTSSTWWYLIGSSAVQMVYMLLLTKAYSVAEFSTVYPLARGLSPLLVAIVSVLALGERLSAIQLAGVVVVSASLIGLTFVGHSKVNRVGVTFAVLTGVAIATYTITDGIGVRTTPDALSYSAWLFLIQGVALPIVCVALAPDRRKLRLDMREHAALGLTGGVMSLVAYGIVVWAQSIAPLALVSALRESSVLLAGVVGWLVFKERFSRSRALLTCLAVAGLVVMELC